MVATYALPALGVIAAAALGIARGVHAWELWLFAGLYLPTLAGITIGFHRLFSHRAFRVHPFVRAGFAIAGSMAGEGPVIKWAAVHMKHHANADEEGDPHSPNVGAHGPFGLAAGLWNGSFGWLFGKGNWLGVDWTEYPAHLMQDRLILRIHDSYFAWLVLGLVIPAGLGAWFGDARFGALEGFLWGGLVRMAATHLVIGTINSVGHRFGTRPNRTGDQSTNLFWLAIPSLGDGWHNNHHALPGVASLRFRFWELDPGAAVVRALELAGLASDVHWPTPAMIAAKRHRTDT
jgi:stearoyl-CoA desaturase (delta-9 desaturase)